MNHTTLIESKSAELFQCCFDFFFKGALEIVAQKCNFFLKISLQKLIWGNFEEI